MGSYIKYLLFFLIFTYSGSEIFAQKPAIDTSVYHRWPSLGSAAISSDGKYVLYEINNRPLKSVTLVIQGTDGDLKFEIPGISSAKFTEDSRMAIFVNMNDSLCLLSLADFTIQYIPHVISFNLSGKGSNQWIAYQLDNPLNDVVIKNLINGGQREFPSVIHYRFTDDGRAMLLQTESRVDTRIRQALYWLDLSSNNLTNFWEGLKASNFVLDDSNAQLAFREEDKDLHVGDYTFWYFKEGTDKAVMLADNNSIGLNKRLKLEDINIFDRGGGKLFIRLKQMEDEKTNPDAVPLNVWSYADSKLQYNQLQEMKDGSMPSYDAVCFLKDHHILQLTFIGDSSNLILRNGFSNDFCLFSTRKGDGKGWNKFADSNYLMSTNDGIRRYIKDFSNADLSPEGKYLVYYDALKGDYFGYETISGITRNITKNILTSWASISITIGASVPRIAVAPPAGWVKGDSRVLIFDTFDIWEVDPSGRLPPINLTNGYGRKHHIVFRFINDVHRSPISSSGKVVISAFNRDTKENGFFSIEIGMEHDPKLLTMGAYTYYAPQKLGSDSYGTGIRPIKASNAVGYVVTRMNSATSNNFYYTMDFKSFTRLSNLNPERTYNWMSAELITWKTSDGIKTQGILYKPENFDSAKKYPVIFYYYNLLSDNLNTCLKPEVSDGALNIAWYVSNEYLVVEPDLYYKINMDRLESAYHTVISAAKYLATFSYVDSKKMGIQGISWGGIQTNYIVTHTNLFEAACSASSQADFISAYGELSHGGNMDEGFPGSQPASLWEKPDWYIQHSPVITANKVVTPLLMFETTHDGACPFTQAVEFFTDLRRLGKTVWMLEYEVGNHSVAGRSADDFSIRMSQFFDYYLKGKPAPKWMVEGIPASKKGIDDGLQLEPPGVEPGPNLLTPEEQRKIESLKHRKPITITIQ